MHYTRIEAEALYQKAVDFGLSGSELLRDAEAVMRDCNGCGADWMPDSLTQIITRMFPVMELPAAIHDRRYAIGIDRLAADTEFLANVMLVNERTYAWWHPLRYINRKRAERYYTYLRQFGGKAWREAKGK